MFKRKLNEIEYLVWTFGQPNNLCMAITIQGNLNRHNLREALNSVQEKHSMLNTQLYIGDD
jgi:hypothetical protein